VRRIFTLGFLAAVAVAGWLACGLLLPVAPGAQTFVLLHTGYSTRRIAAELKSAGVIRSADALIFLHSLHHRRYLKAGEYLFEKPATALDIESRLVRGDVYVHTVVIPEGFNMFEIAGAIQNAGLGSSQDFVKVATADTALISDLAPQATSLEGYLFPNTYEFTRAQTMADMAAAMVRQFRQTARDLALTRDVHNIVTLASIVEKETAIPEERPEVAGVYYNRLRDGVPLQADPTVIYAELLRGMYTGGLHHDDMRFDSSYNTYIHPGLPAGPIGNPGKNALQAALHPATTDFLYFVSDGTGHHRFARTLEEHNRNVAAFRKTAAGKMP
jgi:UPF0755 protein